MVQNDTISINDISTPQREFKLVPKTTIKTIAQMFKISQKSIKDMIKSASEAAAQVATSSDQRLV